MNTHTTTTMRWIAPLVIAAGIATGIVAGSAVAAADNGATTNGGASGSTSGTTIGPVNDGASSRNLQEEVGVKNPKPPRKDLTVTIRWQQP